MATQFYSTKTLEYTKASNVIIFVDLAWIYGCCPLQESKEYLIFGRFHKRYYNESFIQKAKLTISSKNKILYDEENLPTRESQEY